MTGASFNAADGLPPNPRRSEVKPKAADPAIAAWLAENKPTKLPRRKASAPPIALIRGALKQGRDITFKRGKSRAIVFTRGGVPLSPQSGTIGPQAPVHDEGGGRVRRQRRRLPSRKGTLL